jgi:putative component of membrane protein insertase Oxa1/YidC/SpoIIIJ protein YidD
VTLIAIKGRDAGGMMISNRIARCHRYTPAGRCSILP